VPYALYAEQAGEIRKQPNNPNTNGDDVSGSSAVFKSPGNGGNNRSVSPNSKFPASGNSFSNANNGNLGIGTTNPSEKLEVNGNIKAHGNMIVLDTDGNPRKLVINPDGTWTIKFSCMGTIIDRRD